MRVLIAEDDSTTRSMLAAVLKKEGYEPVEAVDGVQAWKELQKAEAPELVILDWMMPGMEGPEVLRLLRSQPSESPPYVLMLTSRKEKEEVIAGLKAGANDYLAKPFDSGELLARVQVGCRMLELQNELVKSREILAYQAAHDPLTGLLNHKAILDRLHNELQRARRHLEVLSVGMCDIDKFKAVNDIYGHQAGDDVLIELARILTGCCREYDSIGRLGGEEFLIIAPMRTDRGAASLFDRIRRSVAEARIMTRSGVLSVTVSIGVAAYAGGDTVDGFLSAADAALYRAKEEGRNRVVFSDRSL